jgi:hypothetical protein
MNNNTSKILANNVKKLQQADIKHTVASQNSSLISDIVNKVRENVSNKFMTYLIFAIIFIVILSWALYKYNYNSRTKSVIDQMGYKDKIAMPTLPSCFQIKEEDRYKLCDYYISSSYMTPCVGNQHYDYVSLDMIIEVLRSGARYIQIPICESDVSLTALPVIGTVEYGQKIITSMNTLTVMDVLNQIRLNSFKLNNKQINYPLIVHFILNTENTYTLNNLADNIQNILSDVLVTPDKYKTFPIFLEKICNLLGKIILFATPQYKGSNLESYIIPTTKLFEVYNFDELSGLNFNTDMAFTNLYNNKLSTKQQTKSNSRFKKKYPNIDVVLKNVDTIGKDILTDKEILSNLTYFNKIGMTLVKPHNPEDVLTSNFDPTDALYYGCQFIAMNFHINDNNMKKYLTIFKDSSFRLKPSSMRFSEVEEPTKDMLAFYNNVVKKDENVLNDFLFKYGSILIALESYSLPKTYITQIENNLRFNVGTKQSRDPSNGNTTYNIGLSQCFIPRKSTIGSSENVSIYLESVALPGTYITLTGNLFMLQTMMTKKADLLKQAFYVEKPKTVDNEQNKPMISIRTTDSDLPMYISFENKLVKAYADSPQVEAHNNMSFYVNVVPFQMSINIITLFDGSLKTIGKIVAILENNTTDGNAYNVIKTSKSTNNFNIFKDEFMLQNKKTKTYLSYNNETSFLIDTDTQPNMNSGFKIIQLNGYYTIINNINQQLVVFKKNLIKFTDSKNIISNENLFKININYDL